MSDAFVDKAKDEATAARARLIATAQEIQVRLEPSHLFEDAVGTVREKSTDFARTAGDTIRERPGVFGAAAAAGVLLVLRKPLGRLGRKLFRRKKGRTHETEGAAAG